ncbi:AAA family ATPase [Pantoea sp. Bo_7]|uniref:AAA family ATPase n=1 Tax=unclassified Pantoea TaxID=2630326 RepID=UPI001231B574|nr:MULTISPECIES: AAA family ATPase [unclassified Pantoea]KAA6050460.1 AAA family ATPase [Pantoea sp. Bo_7]KAA6094811.1 AAA family ATPase [Pantoea sp. Bo_10]
MSEFFINQLQIQNFRGIPGYLNLDLSAPLTLISAANGSGKSSVCQAIEWLLAGTSDNVTPDSLRCKSGEGETFVSAECCLGGSSISLLRRPEGLFQVQKEKNRKISDRDFLSLITQNVPGFGLGEESRPNVKKEWLRRSRWLYSSALSMLVDNEYAEHRQQIFANILGYGHLLPMQKNLRLYVQNLSSDRELLSRQSRLKDEIKTLESVVRTDHVSQGQIIDNISKFSQLTGFSPDEQQLPDKQCDNAAMFLATKQHSLSSRQAHLNNIIAGWASLESTAQREKGLNVSIDKLQKVREPLISEIEALHKKMHQDSDELTLQQSRLNYISEQHHAISEWEQLSDRLSDETGTAHSMLNTDLINLLIPATRMDENECRTYLAAWQRLTESQSRWENVPGIIAGLNSRILAAPREDNILLLQEEVHVHRNEHAKQTDLFNSLSSSHEQLQVLGMQVAGSGDGDDCPLCGTHHGSHDALIIQLKKMSSTAGSLSLLAQNAVAKSLNNLQRAEQALNEATKLKQDADQAHKDILRIEADAEKVILASGIRKWQPNTSITEFIRVSGDAMVQAELAVEFLEFNSALTSLEVTAGSALNVFLSERVKHAREWFQKETSEAQQVIAQLKYNNEQDALKLTQADKEKLSADNALSENESGLRRLLEETSHLIDSWKTIAHNLDINIQHREVISQTLEDETDKLNQAHQLLEQVKAALKVSSDMATLEKTKASLLQVQHKLAIREQIVTVASQTRDAWDRHIDNVAKQSLDQLLLPASELFSRMHANEVYQALSMGKDQGAFCWEAVMNNVPERSVGCTDEYTPLTTLNAQTHFSQGQRQDLALSLFLARARTLKGSFFLDEPVAHLDDLNRVAMIDVFRMLTNSEPNMRLVLTTASQGLRRHMRQKFSTESCKDKLRIITLHGNPLHGVTATYS